MQKVRQENLLGELKLPPTPLFHPLIFKRSSSASSKKSINDQLNISLENPARKPRRMR